MFTNEGQTDPCNNELSMLTHLLAKQRPKVKYGTALAGNGTSRHSTDVTQAAGWPQVLSQSIMRFHASTLQS